MILFCMAVLFLAAPVLAAEGPWQRNEQSSLRLVTPYEVASPEGEYWFGVEFELAPGWHVYWKNAGDAGYPPALDLSATAEVTQAELLFPAPHRYNLAGGLVAFGYSDQVIYPVRSKIQAEGLSLELLVNVDYVVCEAECIPYRHDLELTQALGEIQFDSTQQTRLASWRGLVPALGPNLEGRIERVDSQEGRLVIDLPFSVQDLFFEVVEALGMGVPTIDTTAAGAASQSRVEIPVSRLDLTQVLPGTLDLTWTATGVAEPGTDALAASLAVSVPTEWQTEPTTDLDVAASEAVPSKAMTPTASPGLWWYWLPVVLAAFFYLGSGALTARSGVLRTAWIAGIAAIGLIWFWVGSGTQEISPPVIAIGAWLLLVGAAVAFAGRKFSGTTPLAVAAAGFTVSLLPAAPGIGWVGTGLLVLAVIATRSNREAPSRLALGIAGFLALVAVVARFYLLGGLIAPTPLAGVQLALLVSVAGAWMAVRARGNFAKTLGWLLALAGAVGVLYFVV